MEKERKLTLKQRKFIKYYLETGNQSEAARRAGYALAVSGRENILKPTVRAAFMALLDKKGLTDEKITDKLIELIEAKKPISDAPDNQTQIKAVELLMKVKSLIGGDKTIIDQSSHQTNVLLQLREMYEEKKAYRKRTIIDATPEISE